MTQDLYDYNKILARYDQNLEKWKIAPENKKTIIKFKQFLLTSNYSIPRTIKYVKILSTLARIVPKPFTEWGDDEIFMVVEHLHKKGLKEWTKVKKNGLK